MPNVPRKQINASANNSRQGFCRPAFPPLCNQSILIVNIGFDAKRDRSLVWIFKEEI